jgi:hypothetical protein
VKPRRRVAPKRMRVPAKLSNDPLRYEKGMLDGWFRARFVEFRPPEG